MRELLQEKKKENGPGKAGGNPPRLLFMSGSVFLVSDILLESKLCNIVMQ